MSMQAVVDGVGVGVGGAKDWMTHAMQQASSSQLRVRYFSREFSKVFPHRFLPVISDAQPREHFFVDLSRTKCTPGGAEGAVILLSPSGNVSSASGVSRMM